MDPAHDKILMIVPSRGRPENIRRLAEAWQQTSAGVADLLVAIDSDDPRGEQYAEVWREVRVTMITDERRRLVGTLNHYATTCGSNYFVTGFLGDDHLPQTPAWDQRFLDELHRLHTGIVYGNDLFQGANLPTAVVMTSDIIATLGYMAPPGLQHLYVDDAWAELGRGIGRLSYLPDVVIEHLHPAARKAEMDASYTETNSDAQYQADHAAFAAYRATDLEGDLKKLKELITCG